ncbi:MAG: hypothetical protein PW843_29170 [Azospirillaceae bacterium]|nr:hypothetical protein [Azospirillaceae bacterium]
MPSPILVGFCYPAWAKKIIYDTGGPRLFFPNCDRNRGLRGNFIPERASPEIFCRMGRDARIKATIGIGQFETENPGCAKSGNSHAAYKAIQGYISLKYR